MSQLSHTVGSAALLLGTDFICGRIGGRSSAGTFASLERAHFGNLPFRRCATLVEGGWRFSICGSRSNLISSGQPYVPGERFISFSLLNLPTYHPNLSMNRFQLLPAFIFLLTATALEVSGDAIVRLAMYNHAGIMRLGLMLAGAALLFGYGISLNLAPVEFRQVVGLYIATLFIVWQIINFIVFRTVPDVPILIGGALIVTGGLIVTFWRANCST